MQILGTISYQTNCTFSKSSPSKDYYFDIFSFPIGPRDEFIELNHRNISTVSKKNIHGHLWVL